MKTSIHVTHIYNTVLKLKQTISHSLLLLLYGFGSLVRHWTMGFEAKHNYLLKVGQNIGNYSRNHGNVFTRSKWNEHRTEKTGLIKPPKKHNREARATNV